MITEMEEQTPVFAPNFRQNREDVDYQQIEAN